MSNAYARHEEAMQRLHDAALADFGQDVATDIAVMIQNARMAAANGDKTAHTFALAAIKARIRRSIAEQDYSAE